MVSIRERANAFLNVLDRPVPKFLFGCWGVIATWDTFVSQFIPEDLAKSFPKAHQVMAMSYGWLSIQSWIVIGAIMIVLISLEYAARHRWRLESVIGHDGGPTRDGTRLLRVVFWICVATTTVAVWSLSAFMHGGVADHRPVTAPSPVPSPMLAAPAAQTAPPKPSPNPAPPSSTPKPEPWVTNDEIEKHGKLGRKLLIYSPQEIFQMYEGGQNLGGLVNRWIMVKGPIGSLAAPEKIKNKDYYVVSIALDNIGYSRGAVHAYFDAKKWGDALVNIRPGVTIRVICQLTDITHTKINPSYEIYSDVIIASNCDSPQN
jgi:hypothetical protein